MTGTPDTSASPVGAGTPERGADHDGGTGAGRAHASASAVATRLRRLVAHAWIAVLLLGVWEIVGRVYASPYFPPFSEAAHAFFVNWFSTDLSRGFVTDNFVHDFGASLGRAAQGWLVAVVIGLCLGILLGVSERVAAVFNPLIRFGMSIPSTALLPLAVVFFGITDRMNIALIVSGTLFTILINTMDGVRGIDRTVIMTARSMRLGKLRYFFTVLLPGASPQIVSGLRVSLGIGLILMVVSELFAATNGIGYYIVLASRQFRYADMWSGVLLIAVFGLIVNGLFALAENRVLRWHRESRKRADPA
jgi:ABC-type nitrate/sulfonate/bicarbonate transport system permease component